MHQQKKSYQTDSFQTMWTPTDEFREARGSIWRKCNPNTPARVLYSLYEPGLQQQKSKIYTVDFFVTLQNGILVITCVSGVVAYCRFTHWKAKIYSFKMVYDRNLVLSTSSSRVLNFVDFMGSIKDV